MLANLKKKKDSFNLINKSNQITLTNPLKNYLNNNGVD